jgi:hypothetical protein
MGALVAAASARVTAAVTDERGIPAALHGNGRDEWNCG